MSLLIRPLGLQPYDQVWQAMRRFTDQRDADTPDEIWLVEHPPVYTLGLKTDPAHLISPPPHIPLVQTDRGGQVTYHGPGQLILYPLLDLKRNRLTARRLVHDLEKSVIELLSELNMDAHARPDAPGVYVRTGKIASIGLKIRRGFSYHGIALNWRMDLTPFDHINPCGLRQQPVAQICFPDGNDCPDKDTLWRNWVEKVTRILALPSPVWTT